MSNLKRDVEKAIGAYKYDGDTWAEVFDRVNSESGFDIKMAMHVLISILEELDAKEKVIEIPADQVAGLPEEAEDSRPESDDVPTEDGVVQGGAGGASEEV